MKSGLISFFASRSILVNLIFFGVLLAGVIAGIKIGKEEMPDFESNKFRIYAPYIGATAEEIETLVTRPIEKELKGISGIESIQSTSNIGMSNVVVEIDRAYGDYSEVIQNVKDAVERSLVPVLVKEDITYRQFKTSEKAILDIALIYDGERELDDEKRKVLQDFSLSLEDHLTTLSQVSGVDVSGKLQPELQVLVDLEKLKRFSMPLSRVLEVLRASHYISPSGSLENQDETKVTVVSELDEPDKLKSLVVRSNSAGQVIRLDQIATIRRGFEKRTQIQKVNGHEAIIFNVKKSTSTDILKARDAVFEFVESLERSRTQNGVRILLIDDESFDVRNRISIISMNGLLGFVLILIILFIFLDFRSGIWAASGIPFTLCLTLSVACVMGYTLNNMTLAAIIIVLGIVVDDAIIVAENVSRMKQNGESVLRAVVLGTQEMALPITAAILTTIAAFVPMYFFSGRFSSFVILIPILVALMLGSSLIEALFVLPAHLKGRQTDQSKKTGHWFFQVEKKYAKILKKLLENRVWVIAGFVFSLVLAGYLFQSKMKFVLFPREETREIFLRAEHKELINRFEMSRAMEAVEDVLMKGNEENVVAVRTSIARSRWGGEIRENKAFVRIELFHKDERKVALAQLMKQWKKKLSDLDEFKQLRFIRHRFGQASGSPISIEIRASDDEVRALIAKDLEAELNRFDVIENVEIDEPLMKEVLEILPNQKELSLSQVNPTVLSENARAYLNGVAVYTFVENDEEIDAVVKLESRSKQDIEQIGQLLIENAQGVLVPIKRLVDIEKKKKPTSIRRINHKRTTMIHADLKKGAHLTPLEIAEKMEGDFFRQIQRKYPLAAVSFKGEVEDSRDSKADFKVASVIVLLLIYSILILLFNSLNIPFIIMLIIPFGLMGVIYAFLIHGMNQFGFFSIIGTLGMIGVVVNDSIVLVSKLGELQKQKKRKLNLTELSEVSSTRLRAILVTTFTTVAGLLPTAYGALGYDSMLAEMMLAMAWGLIFGTVITLVLTPSIYSYFNRMSVKSI